MKSIIADALQIILAILVTMSVAVYAKPIANEPQTATIVANAPEPTAETNKPAEAQKTSQDEIKQVECNEECQTKKKLTETTSQPSQSAGVAATTSQPVSATKGSCEDWMTQAGVPITAATKTLIINESGCRPDAVNPSSGACGIPQALPCSKLPCTLQDPVCQLKWMNEYVQQRYTTWEGALAYWHCIGQCTNNYGTITKTNTWY